MSEDTARTLTKDELDAAEQICVLLMTDGFCGRRDVPTCTRCVPALVASMAITGLPAAAAAEVLIARERK